MLLDSHPPSAAATGLSQAGPDPAHFKVGIIAHRKGNAIVVPERRAEERFYALRG
jgi:hypothetical protein